MATYIRLTEYKSSELKEQGFFNEKNKFVIKTSAFSEIPGYPFAYWISEKVRKLYNKSFVGDYVVTDGQNKTGNNNKFLRFCWEVNGNYVINYKNEDKKWLFYMKGGSTRKWYGNIEYVINWSREAREFYRKDKIARLIPEYMWYRKGISWSLISNGDSIGFRYILENATFDVAGSSVFFEEKNEKYREYILALLNTPISRYLLGITNPTVSLQVKDIKSVPLIISSDNLTLIKSLLDSCVLISKSDWDSHEVSWDFKLNELLKFKDTEDSIKDSIVKYIDFWTKIFFQLHMNEEKLNNIFIEIYGLQEELTPEVPLSDITILKDEIAERNEENKTIMFDELVLIKQFISYAVGCMVGRYSLDFEGLVYAGGEFDSSKYKTFNADKDGIIPILSDDRFDDDITARFKEFVKVVFGEKNYSTNIDYIANVLGRKDDETAIECIRRYFLNDFYKDHLKMYKKRPIYWLYSSGKEKGFNAIVYMHRYKKETISILRMDYLHKLQRSYDSDYETAERQEKSTSDSKQKIQLQKRMIYLKAVLQELKKYDELLRHYADKQVEIDLDDGVVVNYDKFKELLVKI